MVNEDDSALDNKKKWKYTYKKIFPIFTKKPTLKMHKLNEMQLNLSPFFAAQIPILLLEYWKKPNS